jgi:hypothetical protein
VVARSRRLGNQFVAIQDATIRFQRLTDNGAIVVGIDEGAELFVPLLDPIELPELWFVANGSMTSGPFGDGLRFGPWFEGLADVVPLRLQTTPAGLRLYLDGPQDFTLLGSTVTLSSFEAISDGTFSGIVTISNTHDFGIPLGGSAQVDLGSGTLTLSRVDGVTRLTVPASDPLTLGGGLISTIPIGNVDLTASGWIDSAGGYDVGLAARIRNTAITGSVAGSLCLSPFFDDDCLFAVERTIGADGRISMPFGAGPSTFPIFGPLIQALDTTPPLLLGREDIRVVVPAGFSSTTVHYTSPVAVDDVDTNPTVTCSPSSGSTFDIGTRTVSCTARDSRNNVSPPRTFRVTVDPTPPTLFMFQTVTGVIDLTEQQPAPPVMTKGQAASIRLAGYGPGTPGKVTLFSDPVELATGVADDDGILELSFTVPDVPAGAHTVIIEGRGRDGVQLLVSIPVEVAEVATEPPPPTLPAIPSPPLPAVPPVPAVPPMPPALPTAPDSPAEPFAGVPSGGLPATGAAGIAWMLSFAGLLVLAGLALRAGGDSRRRARLRSDRVSGGRGGGRGPRTAHAAGGSDTGGDRVGQGAVAALVPRPGR